MMLSDDQRLVSGRQPTDIPASDYRKAAARHRSLAEWLCRPKSKVAVFKPHVSAQGFLQIPRSRYVPVSHVFTVFSVSRVLGNQKLSDLRGVRRVQFPVPRSPVGVMLVEAIKANRLYIQIARCGVRVRRGRKSLLQDMRVTPGFQPRTCRRQRA
jgi:hypothetical protein